MKYSSFVATLAAGKQGGGTHAVDQTCGHCGKKGHHAKDCRTRIAQEKTAASKRNGKDGGKGGNKGGGNKNNNGKGGRGKGNTRDMSKITCHNCGKQGHYASDCPDKASNNTGNAAKPGGTANAQFSDAALADLSARLKSGEIKLINHVSDDNVSAITRHKTKAK